MNFPYTDPACVRCRITRAHDVGIISCHYCCGIVNYYFLKFIASLQNLFLCSRNKTYRDGFVQ